MLVRRRGQENPSKEMERQILSSLGLGLSEVVDAIKANVVFSDLDDVTRAAVLGIYFGLSMGLERNGGGIDLEKPFQETDF